MVLIKPNHQDYTLRGDGTADAFVKVLKNCIQKQVNIHGSDWDLYLQPTTFAVRNTIMSSTKISPAEIVLGAKLQEPIDKFLPATDKQPFNQKQAALFTKQLVDRLEDTTLRVKQELAFFCMGERRRYLRRSPYTKKARSPGNEVDIESIQVGAKHYTFSISPEMSNLKVTTC